MSFVCVDRVPDLVYRDLVADSAVRINPANARGGRRRGPFEAAGDPTTFWLPGTTLRVRFLDGPAALHEQVMVAAVDWTIHAALRFAVVDSGDAEIRVTFDGDGNWSALGTTATVAEMFALDEATMCLSEVPSAAAERVGRISRHEFGHAIGLVHEHSSPASGMNWNKPEVYRALAGPPNYWTPEQVEYNVFERYATETTRYTAFDPESVMLYAFPAEWTLDGVTFPENNTLSPIDRAFVASVYPSR
jgi:hypothetical protein